MTTTLELADAIGRKKIASALSVGVTAVSNAVVRGHFPASWYLAIREMAARAGHDCPPELFQMRTISQQNKSPEQTPSDNAEAN